MRKLILELDLKLIQISLDKPITKKTFKAFTKIRKVMNNLKGQRDKKEMGTNPRRENSKLVKNMNK